MIPRSLLSLAALWLLALALSLPEGFGQSQPELNLEIRVFHDYNGNGQFNVSVGEYAILGVVIKAGDKICHSNQEGVCVIEGLQRGQYRLAVEAPSKFTHILPSPERIVQVGDGFSTNLEDEEPNLPLAEGFLTLPFRAGTSYFVGISYTQGRYYDRDASEATYLWWNGNRGVETARGYGVNHVGTDFGAEEGVPVVASAPGVVLWTGTLQAGELAVLIGHVYDMGTGYAHLQRWVVSRGQRVARGQIIGYNGMTGTSYPHVHFESTYSTQQGRDWVDPYRPMFDPPQGLWANRGGQKTWLALSPGDTRNRRNYWTVENRPRFP